MVLLVPALDWANPYFASSPAGACGNWIIGRGMYELVRYALPVLLAIPLAAVLARFVDDDLGSRAATWGLAVVAIATVSAAATRAVPDTSEWDRLLGYSPWVPVEHNVARRVPPPDGIAVEYLLHASVRGADWNGDPLLLAAEDGPALEIARGGYDEPTLRLVGASRWQGVSLSDEPTRMALYRVEGGWLVTTAGWELRPRVSRVILRPDSWTGPVSAASVVPALGAPQAVAWGLAAAMPVAGALLLAARLLRRRLECLARLTSAILIAEPAGLASDAVTADGTRIGLGAPIAVPPGIRFALMRTGDERTPAYRDDARAKSSGFELSGVDRDARIAEMRTQIARLEALAVLVMILLATPGLVALARGLTLSLGLR